MKCSCLRCKVFLAAVSSKEDGSDILPPFTVNELADRVRNAEEQWPVCVLFTNPG